MAMTLFYNLSSILMTCCCCCYLKIKQHWWLVFFGLFQQKMINGILNMLLFMYFNRQEKNVINFDIEEKKKTLFSSKYSLFKLCNGFSCKENTDLQHWTQEDSGKIHVLYKYLERKIKGLCIFITTEKKICILIMIIIMIIYSY